LRLRHNHVSVESLSDEQCRGAVREALDSLPAEMRERLGDVAIVIEDRHAEGLMGIYDPTGGLKRIVIFREANPSREEIRKTVLHEIGHLFGLDEHRLRELGYG
jgi:predicted Zn-dependent protease with MMP-like domain